MIYHRSLGTHSPYAEGRLCLVFLQQGLELVQFGTSCAPLVPQWPFSSTRSPLTRTDINTTAPSNPQVASAIILICSSTKNIAGKNLLLHELWASNRKELFPSSFHSFLPNKGFRQSKLTSCTGIRKYYLGASEKTRFSCNFLFSCWHWIRSLDLAQSLFFASLQGFTLSRLCF